MNTDDDHMPMSFVLTLAIGVFVWTFAVVGFTHVLHEILCQP